MMWQPQSDQPRCRARSGAAVSLTIAFLFVSSCLRGPNTVAIGSKAFTESFLMSTMAALLLKENGYTILERFGVGSMIARQALLTEQIDLYPEYTGTAYTLYLQQSGRLSGHKMYEAVKSLDRNNGVVWLDRTRVNNTYALAVRNIDKKKIGKTLSDLSRYNRIHPGELTFGIDHEFYERPDGFKAMARAYGLTLQPSQVRTMEIGLSFESIARGQIDVAMVYSTDGKLKKYDLEVLEDDLHFFPVYHACFTMNEPALSQHPDIPGILKPLSLSLDNATMQELNFRVDGLGKPAFVVAQNYLRRKGFL